MAWQTMNNLAAGDVVTEADMDALRNNLEKLEHFHNTDRVFTLVAGNETSPATGSTSYTVLNNNYGTLHLIPAQIADNAAVYFRCQLRAQAGGVDAYATLFIDAVEVTGAEVTTNGTTYAFLTSGDLSAQFTGTSRVTVDVRAKNSSGAGSNAYVSNVYLLVVPTA